MAPVGTECQVVAGVFGLAVQGALFTLCVGVLVSKKLADSSRSWRDFLLDSSKQLAGAGWIHILNLLCAEALEAKLQKGDQCEWYWINIVVDCTLGVIVEYFALMLLTSLLAKLSGKESVEDSAFASGDYRDPDTKQIVYSRYTKQLALWLVVVSIMKFSMVLFMITFHQHVQSIASGVLAPTSQNPRLKLLVVMIATPFVMNALQFILVDSMIRKRKDEGSREDCAYLATTASDPDV